MKTVMVMIGPRIVNTWATEGSPAQPLCAPEELDWPVDDCFEEEPESEEAEVVAVGAVIGREEDVAGAPPTCKHQSMVIMSHLETRLTYHLWWQQAQ